MLAIIIITYNSHRKISDCLASVFSQKTSSPLSVIVIDNNSPDKDETEKVLSSFGYPAVEFVQNRANYGFAKAVNQGITIAKKKYHADNYLLLNPDAILEENCVEQLLQSAKKGFPAGLVAATILSPKDKSVWFSQGVVGWWSQKTYHVPSAGDHLMKDQFAGDHLIKVRRHYLSGCCLLVKSDVVDRIGLFDERFFLYYEDADYSLRAQAAGFPIAVAPKAICFHDESQSSSKDGKTYHLCKSGLLFFHKYCPWYRLPYFWMVFWLRLGYHKFYSRKMAVCRALEDFLADSHAR